MILDLFEAFCGARLTTNMFRFGGTLEDLLRGGSRDVGDSSTSSLRASRNTKGLLSNNRIWLERTKGGRHHLGGGCGELGLTAPASRIGGRLRRPEGDAYAVLRSFEFDVPLGRTATRTINT